jgi:hypothetical protein
MSRDMDDLRTRVEIKSPLADGLARCKLRLRGVIVPAPCFA